MLENESDTNYHNDKGLSKIIEWSVSGKAFRIDNVSQFASIVLPKYFRTSKFSSFQRNLNLYGFFKVRRGPDIDMYAHPSFIRGCPEALSHLRKNRCTTSRKTSEKLCSSNFTSTFSTIPDSVSSEIPISTAQVINDRSNNSLNLHNLNWRSPPNNYLNGGKLNLLAIALLSMAD